MARQENELREIIASREALFKEMAIYDSVPPVSSVVVEDAIVVIQNIPEVVSDITSNEFAKNKFSDQVSSILNASDGAVAANRLIYPFPIPSPFPWPPIWLGRSPVVEEDELEFATRSLLTRVSGNNEAAYGSRAAFFLAMGAGVIVGGAIAKILRSSENGLDADTKIAFTTDYIGQVGFSTVKAASISRPDYVSALDACSPVLEAAMNVGETKHLVGELGDLVGERTARIAPAIGFAIGLVLGYMAEAK